MTESEKLAKEIVDYLFENGQHQQAERLVLELPDGCNGGGWSKIAVYDAVLSIISAQQAASADRKKRRLSLALDDERRNRWYTQERITTGYRTLPG